MQESIRYLHSNGGTVNTYIAMAAAEYITSTCHPGYLQGSLNVADLNET